MKPRKRKTIKKKKRIFLHPEIIPINHDNFESYIVFVLPSKYHENRRRRIMLLLALLSPHRKRCVREIGSDLIFRLSLVEEREGRSGGPHKSELVVASILSISMVITINDRPRPQKSRGLLIFEVKLL